MGLDQYVYFRPPPDAEDDDAGDKELFYWRKHADLHGWMERLYRSRGGNSSMFNCEAVDLTLEDIDRLEQDVDSLPCTTGYWFGESTVEDAERTREFIALAREKLNEGNQLYYTSWW